MQTDMGNRGARHFGYEQAFVPVDVACSFAVDKIETATKEETSGKFLTNDKEHPYIEW
jgi:norsolorinic acid ketoreductase